MFLIELLLELGAGAGTDSGAGTGAADVVGTGVASVASGDRSACTLLSCISLSVTVLDVLDDCFLLLFVLSFLSLLLCLPSLLVVV